MQVLREANFTIVCETPQALYSQMEAQKQEHANSAEQLQRAAAQQQLVSAVDEQSARIHQAVCS